jgi:hypothetical protein
MHVRIDQTGQQRSALDIDDIESFGHGAIDKQLLDPSVTHQQRRLIMDRLTIEDPGVDQGKSRRRGGSTPITLSIRRRPRQGEQGCDKYNNKQQQADDRWG